MTTKQKIVYVEVQSSEVPAGLRWDVPARNQGQIVEVAYAAWPWTAAEAGHGDEWQRVFDASDRSLAYFRRAK